MPLYYDDDQTMLADTAGQFMAEEGSIKNQLRHWRDRQCKDGFGHSLWQQFAEMGFEPPADERLPSYTSSHVFSGDRPPLAALNTLSSI